MCRSRIARWTGAHAASLSRLLRGLAAIEVVAIDDGRYRLTPLGEGLLPGASQAHDVAHLVGAEYLPAWAELRHSVMTGEPAFDHVFGMTAWRHRRELPELERSFQRFMTLVDKGTQTAILGAYDFGDVGLIVDVGGGTGGILVAILLAHARARGIVFDRPEAAGDAARVVAAAGVADRCTVASGSFLDAVPAGGDVYILSRVLHDWDDERCRTILRACRVAMPARGVLLIAESLLDDDGGAPVHLAMRDLHMLAVLGGQERTQAEYADLLAATGFKVARVTRGRIGPDVIEARPAHGDAVRIQDSQPIHCAPSHSVRGAGRTASLD